MFTKIGRPQHSIIFAGWSVILLSGIAMCAVDLNVTRVLSSDDGKVYIYDKAMPPWITQLLYQYFSRSGSDWKFVWPDPIHPVPHIEAGNSFWVSPVAPEHFMKMKPWIVFNRIAKSLTGGLPYVPYEVSGSMIRRGESPTLIKGKNPTENELHMRIFLTHAMKREDMSELVFYDKTGESFGAIQPKVGRIVAWNGTLSYLFKPPDINFVDGEYSLLIKLTMDMNKFQKGNEIIKVIESDRKEVQRQGWPFQNLSKPFPSEANIGAHCTRKFYDKRGGVVAFFDNILSMDELAALRSYLMRYETAYTYNGYIQSEDDDADNVSWMMMLKSESILTSRIWNVIHSIATYLSNETEWHPYDVSMNIIQNNFHTRIHEDCEKYEHEYTFLMYLNPDWDENMYGETIFLNQIRDPEYSTNGTVVVDKEYEMFVSVSPKYGRAVMFRNNIPHSARPPSPSFTGARYSFAVKVGRNKLIARSKTLREALEMKSDAVGDPGHDLYNKLTEEMADGILPLSLEEVEKNLAKYRAEKDEMQEMDKKMLKTSVLMKKYASAESA